MWVGGTAGCEGIERAGGKVKEKRKKEKRKKTEKWNKKQKKMVKKN